MKQTISRLLLPASLLALICATAASQVATSPQRTQAPPVFGRIAAPTVKSGPLRDDGKKDTAAQKPVTGFVPGSLGFGQVIGERGAVHVQLPRTPFGAHDGEIVSIAFRAGEFVPPAGERIGPGMMDLARSRMAGNQTPQTRQTQAPPQTPTIDALILLNDHLDDNLKAQLKALGVEWFGFYPHAAYQARIPAASLQAVAALPQVQWVGQPTLGQKLDPKLWPIVSQLQRAGKRPLRLYVSLFGPDPNGSARKTIQAAGSKINIYDPTINILQLDATVPSILRMAALDSVLYIEPVPDSHPGDVRSVSGTDADAMWTTNDPFPPGDARQVKVGIMDTGMYAAHTDFDSIRGGTWGFSPFAGESWFNDTNGHGTSIAGILLGEGNGGIRFRGVLPDLHDHGDPGNADLLVAQVFSTANPPAAAQVFYGLQAMGAELASSVPGDIRQVFNYSGGAPVFTNTNGRPTAYVGPYYGTSVESRKVDFLFRENVLPVIAAGNQFALNYTGLAGVTSTITSPGDAKGAFTVGAVNADDIPAAAGLAYYWFGAPPSPPPAGWAPPITIFGITDAVSMFSSRGPTGDGRVKPDVVAPGFPMDSVRTQTDHGYSFNSAGTSDATPMVTGLAAGMIGNFPTVPAWGIKSIMIAGAVPIPPRAALGVNDGVNDQGWGKIDAQTSLYSLFDSSWAAMYGDNVGAFQSTQQDFNLPQDAVMLKFVLCYPDAPAGPGPIAIKNDVDVLVQDIHGNVLADTSKTQPHDTVKVITLQNVKAGLYHVTIATTRLGEGDNQKWAVTARWSFGDINPQIALNVKTPYAVQGGTAFDVNGDATPATYIATGIYGTIDFPAADFTLNNLTYLRPGYLNGGDVIPLANPYPGFGTSGWYNPSGINQGNAAAGWTRYIRWTLTATGPDGTYDVTYSVRPSNGQPNHATAKVIIDSTPPALGPVSASNWGASFTPDVTIGALDALSGLQVGSAQYIYSTDGGFNWSGWTSAPCSGADKTTAQQTITISQLPFNQNNRKNLVVAYIYDMAGNSGALPATRVWFPYPVSVGLSPTTVTGGNPVSGTVTLNDTPDTDVSVALSSSDPSATVPATVTVSAGTTTATFPVTTLNVTSQKTATITATLNGLSASSTVTVQPVVVQSIDIAPTSVFNGDSPTGTVTLTSAAPAGGISVTLSSSDTTSATVPATLSFAAGATKNTFPVTTLEVTAPVTVTVTASLNGSSQTAQMTVNPIGVASLNLNPNDRRGGGQSTGTVTLQAPAAIGDVVVTLSSNNPAATVPASVTIPAGQTTGTFTIDTSQVTVVTKVTIAANANGVGQSASLTLRPFGYKSLKFAPNPVAGSLSAKGTLILLYAAPPGGLTVTLSSNSTSATVPATISVKSGATSATFSVATKAVTAITTATITASYDTVSTSAPLTIGPIKLAKLTLSPASVKGGNSSTGTVSLEAPAAPGDIVVTLSSSLPAVANPTVTTVTIPAGQTSKTFTVTTTHPTVIKTVTIKGTANAVSVTGKLTVTP